MFRLVLGIQVIEIAEELVEAVHGRQEIVAVAEMVFAELPGRVALRLQQFGDGRILLRQAFLCCGKSDFQEPGPQRTLPGDKGGASGGAGLLPIIVGEDCALIGDAIDVGRAVAHHAAIVGADVPVADVIAHDDEDIGLLRLLREGWRAARWRRLRRERAIPAGCFLQSPSYAPLDSRIVANSLSPSDFYRSPKLDAAVHVQNRVMFALGAFGLFTRLALYCSTAPRNGPSTQLYISPILCSSRGSDSILNILG